MVELTLWNVGGDGEGMEVARGKICSWLRRAWVRRMTCEAGHWFSRRHTPPKRIENKTVLQYSTPFNVPIVLPGGSGRTGANCSNIWQGEASRDGARAFHLGEPPPQRYFPSPPHQQKCGFMKRIRRSSKPWCIRGTWCLEW